MLQWGRDFNVAESRPFRRGTTYTDRLQWGRDFNVAERRYAHANHGVPEICFNGAATLTSRRAVSSSASLNMLPRLQWGRDFNVAESGAQSAQSGAQSARFNGAATLTSRRVAPHPCGTALHVASMGPRL